MSCHHHQHSECKQTALAQAEALCAAKNLRFTDLRRKVFELLWSSHKALTASDVMEVLGRNQPPLTYRALDFLKEQKLIHYVASLNAYVGCTRTAESHPDKAHISQLLICEDCRDVTELPADTAAKTLLSSAQKSGFTPHQTVIETLGLCQNCQ